MYFHAHSIPETIGMAQAAAVSRRPAAPEKPRKLLVAFDGSPAAWSALEHAVDRAQADGSSLHVVNVQEALVDSAGMYRIYRERGERIIEAVAERMVPRDVAFTAEIAFGSPAAAIVRTARDEECDHIILGTTNKTGIASLFSPGVSREVLRLAEVPVTIIKEETK